MAKTKTETSGTSKFQEALDKLNKTYGVGTVLALAFAGSSSDPASAHSRHPGPGQC